MAKRVVFADPDAAKAEVAPAGPQARSSLNVGPRPTQPLPGSRSARRSQADAGRTTAEVAGANNDRRSDPDPDAEALKYPVGRFHREEQRSNA